MKKVIKASQFRTKMCIVDKYGDELGELIFDNGYWKLPKDALTWELDEGDVLRVEEREEEID